MDVILVATDRNALVPFASQDSSEIGKYITSYFFIQKGVPILGTENEVDNNLRQRLRHEEILSLLRPFRSLFAVLDFPGRCPGLSTFCPFGAVLARKFVPENRVVNRYSLWLKAKTIKTCRWRDNEPQRGAK